MSVSKKDIKDISDLIRKKLELYMNVERRESRFDPRGKFTTTPKMHKYDFLYKVLDASVLDAEGRKARQAKGENARPKSSVHSPERAKSAKRSSDRAKSGLVRSSHSPRRDRRQNRRVISPSNEKRRRVDEGFKSGSRKRDGGDRAGRSYPRSDANMDESSIVSDSVQTNASSSVHSRVSSNGIKPKLEDSPSRVVLHREKERLSSYASKIFSEVPVDEIQLIHRYRPSYEDNGEPKYQGFSRHVGSILKSKNFVHFYNNEALHHSVDKENSESRDRLTSSKKPSRMANRAIKSAHVTKGHDDVIRTAKSSRHTVFSSLIDTAGTGTRLVKATSKEFAASSIESLTPTYTSSFHNIETSTFPQSHDPYRPSDANRPPSPADHFRHGRSVSIASIKSSVTVHFNENKLDEKNRSVSFPVIKQPQERRITEDESSDRMREPKKRKEFTEYYEDPNTKVKVDREMSNVEITKRETVEKDEQVYKIKQIVVVSVDDKKQTENDKMSDTEVSESHEISDKEYSESYDATESVNQKSDEEGSERTLSPISDTELTDTGEKEEKKGTVIEGEKAQLVTDDKLKEEKSVTIGDVEIMNAKRHGHLKPLIKSPSPDMAKNKRRRKRSERDKTDKTNNETVSTERGKGTSDTEKQKQEFVEGNLSKDLEKKAQGVDTKEVNSIIDGSAVPCTIAKDIEGGAGHSRKTVDDKHKEVVESKTTAKDEKEVSVSDSEVKIEKSEVILNVSENRDDYEDDFEEEDINLSSREESPRKENQPLATTEKIDVSESTNKQQKTDEASVDKENNEGISMNEPEDDKAGQTKLAVNSDESHTTEKPEENLSDVTGPQKKEDKSSTEVKPEETILEIKQCKNSEETAEIESKTLENKEREDKSFVALPVPVSRPEKLEEPDDIRFGISEISQARKEIVSVNHEAIKENNLHGLHISNSSINTLIISRDHGNQGERETKDNTKALIGKETVLVSKDNAKIECEDDTSNINVESSNSKDIQNTLPSRNESLATQTISSQATQTINSVQIQTISDMQTQTIESTSTQTTIAAESQTDKQRRFSVSSVDSYQVAEYAKENACQIDMVDIATSPIPETLFVLSRHIHLPPEEIKTDSSVTISAEEERAEVTVGDERKEESKSKQVAENDYAQNISNKTNYHLQEEKEIENNKAHTLVSDKLLLGSRENLSSSFSDAKMHNNISKDKSGEIASALNICDRNKESINHLPKEVDKNEFSKHILQYKNNDPFSKSEVSKDGELLPDMSSEEKINTEDEISTNVQEDTHKLDSQIIVEKAETEKQEDTLEDKNLISDEARDDQKQVEIITKPETVDKEIRELTTDALIQGEPDNQSNEFHEGSDKMVDEVTQEDGKEIPQEDKAFAGDKREEHADTHMPEIQRDVEEIIGDNQIRMNQDVGEKEKEEVLETEEDVHGETAVTDLQHKQETKENQSGEQEDENQAMINTEISEKSVSSDRHDLYLEDRVDTLDEKDEKADFIMEEKHQNEEISNYNRQFQTEKNFNKLDQMMELISDEKRTTAGDSKNVTEENTESYTDEHNEKIGSEFQQEHEAEEVKDENQDSEKEKNDISILKKPDEVNHQIQDVSNEKQFNNEDGHIEKGTQGKDDTDEKQDCSRATVVEQERCFKETDSCANTDREHESLDINIEETTSEKEKLLGLKTEETQEIVNSGNESENKQFANEIERGGQSELEIQNKEDSKDFGDLSQVFENTEDEKEQLADNSKQDQDESSGRVNDFKVFKVESHEDETENKSDSREHDKHESEEVIALKVKEEDRKQTSGEEVLIDSKVQEQPSTVDDKQQIIETDKFDERDDQVTDVLLQDKLKTDAKDEDVISETEAVKQDTQIKTEILSEIEDQEVEDVVKYQNITEEQADSKIELKEEIKVSDDKIQDEIMIKHRFEEEETFDSEIQQQLPETKEIIKDGQSVLDKDGSAETTVKSVLLEKTEKTNKTVEEQLKEADELVNEQKESFDTKTQDKTDNEAALHDGNEKLNKRIIHPAVEKPETDNKADEENLKDVKEHINEQMESFETKTIEKQDNEAAPHCDIEKVDKKLIHSVLGKPETTNKLDKEQLIDLKINKADEEKIKDVHEHVNEQEESFKTKSHEKQENESAQHDDDEKIDKKLLYPEDEDTKLSLQQRISREQMNNAESDIQAEEGSKQKEEQRITEMNEEIPNKTESEQGQVEIQTTEKPEGKENEKESKEYDIDIDEKHIDSTLQGRQEKEKREYEELNVVLDGKSDKQAEYSELLRKETQETVETECENKYEKANEQCQIDELTHATFGEKLDNEEKTIETKPFVNEKETDEQDLQNDTVSKENLEVVDIFNLQKEVKIEEKNDPEEVQIDSNFQEKTENIQPRGEKQNDKVDIQVHAEETDICSIMERKPDVEKDKGLDKIEKGNDENKVQVKFKTEEKQEPQLSSNQEIHDEAQCDQQEMNKDLAQKLEAENDDKDIERENREKHIDLTQPDDKERTFEGQSKERDWHTEKQAEKNELGKKDTQESVGREPENKDIETDNQSYKNEQCYSGLEHELDKEERSLVVETLKVEMQTDEQQLLADTAVNETVEISIHKNYQNVEGQSSNEEVVTYSGLHETKEILEKKSESPDFANDIQAHDNEKSTDSAVQGNAIPEICNIEKGNKEDDEKKPTTEEPKETIQSDNLNLDIHNETPSEQKRIKTDITENLEVKEKEIDIKLKTENKEIRIESIFQGEQHTGTVHDIGKGIQEKENKEQIVLDDGLTDKLADIELEEEKIDPTLQEKTTLSVQNYEGSDTTIVKPEDEIEKLNESVFQGKTGSIEEKNEGSQVKEESDKHVDKNISERKEARVIDNDCILVNDHKQNDAVQKQVDNEKAEKQDGEMNKEIKDVLAGDDASNGKEPIDLIKGTTARNEGNNDKFEVVQTEDGNERPKEAFDIKAMHKLMTKEKVNQNQLVESLKGKEEDKKSPDHQDGVETVETHDNAQNIDLKKQNPQTTEVEKQLKTEEGDDKNESLSRIETNLNEETEEKAHKTSIMEVQLLEEHEHKDPKEICANDSNDPTVEADSMSSTAQKPSELKFGSGDAIRVEEDKGQSADKIYAVSASNLDGTSGEEISDTFFEDREKGVNESNTERQVKKNDVCLQHLETTDAKESRQTTGDEGNKHSDHEDSKPHTDLDLASKGLDEKVNTEKESQKPVESGKVGHSETDVDMDSSKTSTQTHINISIENNLENAEKDNELEVLDKNQEQDGKNIHYYSPASEPIESIPAIIPAYFGPDISESCIEIASLGSDSKRNLLSVPEREILKNTTDMDKSFNADVASQGDNSCKIGVAASEKTDIKANESEFSEHLEMEERVKTDTEQFSEKTFRLNSNDQDLVEQNMSEKHTPTAMPDINKITEFIEIKHKTNDDTESEVQVTVKEELKSDTPEQTGMETGEESKETEEVTNDSSNQHTDMLEDTEDVQSHLTELSDNSHSYETTFVPQEEKSQTETTDKSASVESDSSHEPSLDVINESHSEHDINTDSSKILLEQMLDEKHNEVKSIHQKSQETTNEVLNQQLKIDQLSSEIIQKDVDADENIDTSDSINVAEETGQTLKEDSVNEKKSTSRKEIDLNEHLDSNVCESNEASNSTFSQLQHTLTSRKIDDTTAEKDLNITKAEADNAYKDSWEKTIVEAGSRKIDIANDGIQSTYMFLEDTGDTLEKIVNKEEDLDKKLENQSSIRTTVSDKNAHDEEGSLLSVEEGKPYQDKKNIENGHNENKKISQDIKILINNAMDDSKSTETHSSSTPSSNGTYTAASEPSSSMETTSTSVLESLDESELDSTMETEIKNEKPVDCTLIVHEKQDAKIELNDQEKSCTPVYTSSLSDTSVLDETVENEISRGTQEQKCVDESQSGSNSISGTLTISQTPKELVVDTMKTYTSDTERMSEQSDHKDKILSVVKDDKEDTFPINETEPISSDDKNDEQASLTTKEKTSSATEASPVNIEGYQTGENKEKLSENECSKEVSERNETSFSEEDTFTSVSKFTSSSRFTETILVDDSEQDEIIKIDENGEEKDSKNLSIKERDSAQKENCLSEDLITGETGRKLEDKPTLNGEHIEDSAELRLNSGISDSYGSETKDRDNGTVDIYNQDTSQGITDISEASLETNDDENNSKMPRKRAESGMSQILMETTIASLEKTDDSSTKAQTIDIPKRTNEQIYIASANETTSEQRKETKETLTTHQSEIKGKDNSIDKQAMSSSEAELDRVVLKVLSDKQAPTKASSEMKTTPESSNELKDEDCAIQQAENISESADSKVADESSSDVKNLPNKMASNETTTETSSTHESSSDFKDAELIQDQCATNLDYTCVTYTDESTSTIQMDVSDTKNITDKVTPKDTSEMSPTSISTNLLKDAEFALDHSATNSTSTSPMYSDESTSAVQLGKSDAILKSDPTTESSKQLKDAKLVMDVGVSSAESSGNTKIDESISETKLDCSGVKNVDSSNMLKTSEWTIDQSTLKQEHTDSIDNNESTIKVQMDGSDITYLSDMFTSNETRPERKPISESSDELKEAESNVDQTKMKPESNGKEGIDDSTCNVKELLHVHVETKAPSIMEPKPQSYDMKNKDSVPDKNVSESESTVTKGIDKSTFDIHVDGSDATDLYQKQAPTDTTSELTDAKAVKAEGLMKLDAIGLNDTDESLSNVKDVLDKLTPIDTVSVTQPALQQSYSFKDKQLVKHESALKAESTRATDIDDYISKTQLDGSDFEDKADKSNSKETPLEIKHSLEIPNRLKDEELEIDQSASEITSSGLKSVDKSISKVENVPSEQAQMERRAKIESSLEPSNELKDAEPVLDQSATKLKSTSTTLIGEYSSKNLLDASDVKDEPKKHILTQEQSDLLQKPESSDKLKDAKPVIDQSVMEKESTGKTYKAVSDGLKETDESTLCLKDVSDEKAQTETTTEVGPTAELCEELRHRESVLDQSSIKAGCTGSKEIDNSTSIVQFMEPEVSRVTNKEAQSEEMSETISTQESSEYKNAELVIDNRATKIESSETIVIDASSSSIQLDGSDEKHVFDSPSQNEAITETLPLQEPNKVKEVEYLSSSKQETIESAIIFNSTASNDIDESTPDLKQIIEELVQIETKSEVEPILESCHKLKDVESVNLQSTTKEESTGPKVIGESTGSKYMDETTSDVTGVPHQQAPTQVTSELQQTPQTFEKAKDRETVGNQNTATPASTDLKNIEQSVSKIQLEGSVVEDILDENASTVETSQMVSTPKAFYEFKDAESVSGQSATNSGSIDLKDIDESISNLKDTPDEDVPVHSTKVFESTFAEKVNGSDVKEIPGMKESTVAPSEMLSTPEILHKFKDAELITDESAFKHESSYSPATVESTGSKDIDEQLSDLKESPDEQFGLSPESCKEMKDEESVVDRGATNSKDNDESTSNIHFETSGLNNEPNKQVPTDAKSELQLTQESSHQLKDAVSFFGENASELETTDSTVIDECKGLKEIGESISGLQEVSDDQTQTEPKSEVESTTQKCDKLKDEDTVVDQSTTKQKSSWSKDIDESPSKMELMGSNVSNMPERQTQREAAADIETVPKSVGQLINANSLTNQSVLRPGSNDSTVIGESTGSKDMDESSSVLIQVSDEQARPEAKSKVEPKSESYNNLEDKQSVDNQSTTNLESVCSTDIDKTKSNIQMEGSDVNNVPDMQDQSEATPEMETTSIMASQFQDANLVIDQNTSKSDSAHSTNLDESTGSKDTDASSSDLKEISDTKAQTETKSELEPTPETCNKPQDKESVENKSTTDQKSPCSTDIDETTFSMQSEGSNVDKVPDAHAKAETTPEMESTPIISDQFKDGNLVIDQSSFKPVPNDSIVIGKSTGLTDIDESSSDLKEIPDEQAQTETKSEFESMPESYKTLENEESFLDLSTSNQDSTGSKSIDESISKRQSKESNVSHTPEKQAQAGRKSEMENTSIETYQCKDVDSVIDQCALKPDSSDFRVIGETSYLKDIDEPSLDLKSISDEQTKTESKPQVKESVDSQSATNLESICTKDIDDSTTSIQLDGSNFDNVLDKQALSEATDIESTPIISNKYKDVESIVDQVTLESDSTNSTVIDSKIIDETSSDLKEICDEGVQTDTKSEIESTPETCNKLNGKELERNKSETNLESTYSKDIDESTSNIQLDGSIVKEVPEKLAPAEETSEMEPTPESANKFKEADSVINQSTSSPESTDSTVIAKSTSSKDIDEQSSDMNQVSDEQAKTEAKPEVEPTPESCNKLNDEELVDGQSITNKNSTCSTDIDESTTIKQLGGSNVNNVPDKPAQTEATSDMETTSVEANQVKNVNSVIDKHILKPDSTDSIISGEFIDSKDIDESSSDLKEICDEQAQTDIKSEVEPTPETCNKLNDKELERNKSETNLESTFSKDIDDSASNIQLDGSIVKEIPDMPAPSGGTSEMEPTPESANKFKEADSVIDQRASRPDSTESTSSKDIDERSSDLNQVSGEQAKTEAKLEVEPTPESCNKLNDEGSLDDQSTTNQISTFSTDIDESTSIIQLDGSNVNNVPDKPAQTEATSDMETTSVVASQLKDVNSVIDKRTLKPESTDPIVTGESIGSKDIDESSLDLKEVSEKPVLDQNTANQKSTCSQDNDESLSNIPVDVSDVNSLPDEQSLTKETSEMQFTAKSANELEDGETVLNQIATKPEYTGSTVVDETKSNLNDVTDKQTQAKAISDKEPIHESNQLKTADSALDQNMLDTLCSPDINKSTTNSKDLSNEQPKSEQASKMEQTIDSSKESKDAVITQGAVEPLSTVITDTDALTSKIQPDVNDLPCTQVPTEAKLEINTTSESPTESKDAELVIDQTATNPESTCTTVNDESDEKDKHEKDALTQTTPQTKLTTASSNKMKDQTDMEQNKEKPESLGSEDNNVSVSKQQIEGSENKDFLVDPGLAHVTSETDSTPRSSSEETSYTDTFETLSDGQTTQESRFQTSQTSGKVTSQISGDMKESATIELRRSSLSDLEELPLE